MDRVSWISYIRPKYRNGSEKLANTLSIEPACIKKHEETNS